MNEMDKLSTLEKKLEGICDRNNLIHQFRYSKYPITLTIRPAGGIENQISMLESNEADEGNYTSPDACIIYAIKDGDLTYRTSKTFTISEALFTKIKNYFKKMHALYCQYVHRMYASRGANMPEIVPSDGEELAEQTAAEDDLMDEASEEKHNEQLGTLPTTTGFEVAL